MSGQAPDLGSDIHVTNPHIRAWVDLRQETEGNPSLSLKQESGAEGKAWDRQDCKISKGGKPVSKEEGWEHHQQLGVTQTVEPPVQAQGTSVCR